MLHGANEITLLPFVLPGYTRHVYRFLQPCKHSNGRPVCIVYSDSDYEDPIVQGGTVSVNFLRASGEFVGYAEVRKGEKSGCVRVEEEG